MKPFPLPLPADYRLQDVLAFHRRDTESIAEEVSAERLRKGVLLDGVPVVLDIALPAAGGKDAICTVHADGTLTKSAQQQAREAALSILGLRIDPAPFSAFTKKDKLLGALIRRQPGLRIVQSATVFEALTWAIIGQQINLTFAIALRRTFILQAGRQHSSGLWCYPDAHSAAALSLEDLTTRKFSRAKAETLLRLAQLVTNGELQLDVTPANTIEQISAALLAVKGIGPWTVNYGLLRGYGYADCSLHGDVAIRAALQTLLGEEAKPDIKRTEQILAQYSPHRTMAAAHLWASLHPRDDQ
ncbi:DNA-3-methyladenine glycosylase 2 [Pseudoduganella sp. FT25W]|uniref:DNA-3-methyladenine glycosylase II n=1 Tax=Duganella alba TaxID=2666081 RepID=A0A6L5QBL4_9BURK|nr:DNA-3-methyladenine glycosylase 2 [Duganella alba]MRX07107.1 DNA-3-methyladenine glycosylase 2 [Duganella alba]MRX15198.1 DNA-3-methyladenine glycosylase 2 [Duganella alba]